jgi:hypothetical protein
MANLQELIDRLNEELNTSTRVVGQKVKELFDSYFKMINEKEFYKEARDDFAIEIGTKLSFLLDDMRGKDNKDSDYLGSFIKGFKSLSLKESLNEDDGRSNAIKAISTVGDKMIGYLEPFFKSITDSSEKLESCSYLGQFFGKYFNMITKKDSGKGYSDIPSLFLSQLNKQ